MKQHFLKINNLVKTLIVAGFITIVSIPVFAHDKRKAISSTVAIQPSVQYIGSEKSSDLFSVKFNTITPVKFILVIRDGFGDAIYRENFEASSFSKVFKLVNENETDASDLSFSIIVENGKEYRFKVNRSLNLVDEVLITKI